MSGWVYYCDDGRDRIKIGYSVNPLSRLREFRTVNPEIEMLLRERPKDGNGRMLEGKRHEQFEDDHIAGEWYHRSQRLDEWIGFMQACCRYKWSEDAHRESCKELGIAYRTHTPGLERC